ncbi:MAG: hypothetical protein Q9191_005546 [Dirinaria sp. TL-2023a]
MAQITANRRTNPKRKCTEISHSKKDSDGDKIQNIDYKSKPDSDDYKVISKVQEASASKKPKVRQDGRRPRNEIFPFEKLPAELRNKIYTLLLTSSSGEIPLVHESMRALKDSGYDAVNLNRVRLDCEFYCGATAEKAAQEFYDDAHQLLKAVSRAKKQSDAVVEIVKLGDTQCEHLKKIYEKAGKQIEKKKLQEKFEIEFRKLLTTKKCVANR